MWDRNGMIQNITNSNSLVLNWNKKHQFSQRTNFQCFAITRDGSVVVCLIDRKIRLYSKNYMRQAKTTYPKTKTLKAFLNPILSDIKRQKEYIYVNQTLTLNIDS